MKKPTKKLFNAMLFCAAIFSLGITNVTAHGPSNVSLTYDKGTEEMTVSIAHTVSDLPTHYINSVAITVNDVFNATHTYESQPSMDFDYVYPLLLVDGDNVSVTVACVLGGSLIGNLTIGEEPTTTEEEDSIPGYSLVAMILSLATLGMLFRHTARRRQQ